MRLTTILGLLIATSAALADDVSDRTTCTQVRAVMDADSPDRAKVRDIAMYVERTLSTLDGISIANGGAPLYGRMSKEGRANIVATVTATCDEHQSQTLRGRAADIYAGLVALNGIAGTGR